MGKDILSPRLARPPVRSSFKCRADSDGVGEVPGHTDQGLLDLCVGNQ